MWWASKHFRSRVRSRHATDRRTDGHRPSYYNALPIRRSGIIIIIIIIITIIIILGLLLITFIERHGLVFSSLTTRTLVPFSFDSCLPGFSILLFV